MTSHGQLAPLLYLTIATYANIIVRYAIYAIDFGAITRMHSVVSATAQSRRRSVVALRENFAANLKRLFQDRGWNQKTFAEKAGVDPGLLSKWLNLHHFPEDAQIERVCRTLGCTYEDLVRDPKQTADPNAVRVLREVARKMGYDVVPWKPKP